MVKTTKAAIIAAAMMTMMSCAQEKQSQTDSKYIGPSKISVENGVMTPEVLLSLGRLSDPQLSPDKNWILYGVS